MMIRDPPLGGRSFKVVGMAHGLGHPRKFDWGLVNVGPTFGPASRPKVNAFALTVEMLYDAATQKLMVI